MHMNLAGGDHVTLPVRSYESFHSNAQKGQSTSLCFSFEHIPVPSPNINGKPIKICPAL